jgi:hypothetical protein
MDMEMVESSGAGEGESHKTHTWVNSTPLDLSRCPSWFSDYRSYITAAILTTIVLLSPNIDRQKSARSASSGYNPRFETFDTQFWTTHNIRMMEPMVWLSVLARIASGRRQELGSQTKLGERKPKEWCWVVADTTILTQHRVAFVG